MARPEGRTVLNLQKINYFAKYNQLANESIVGVVYFTGRFCRAAANIFSPISRSRISKKRTNTQNNVPHLGGLKTDSGEHFKFYKHNIESAKIYFIKHNQMTGGGCIFSVI